MVGLVLEGGGVKGAYQVGAYKALKKCGIKFDAIVGSSIGSLNAALLVAHKERALYKWWTLANVGRVLGLSDDYINIMNNSNSKYEKTLYSLKEVFSIVSKKGIDINGLRDEIKQLVSEKEIRNSNIEYGLNTVRLKDLKPLYLFKDDIPIGKMYDYMLASCFLPVFKKQKLDNEYFIDGGFYDVSPSNMLENKGYNLIYIIGVSGIGIKHKKINKANIVTITPSKDLGSTLNVNRKQINDNIKLGYYDTIKKIKKLDGYKYIFKRKKDSFYSKLLKRIDKDTLEYFQNMFVTVDDKELVIKSLEYVLKNEKKSYYRVYSPRLEILNIKRMNSNDKVYEFIKKFILL